MAFNLNAQKVTTVDDVEPFFRGLNAEDSVFLDSIKNTTAIYKVIDIKKKQGWYKLGRWLVCAWVITLSSNCL